MELEDTFSKRKKACAISRHSQEQSGNDLMLKQDENRYNAFLQRNCHTPIHEPANRIPGENQPFNRWERSASRDSFSFKPAICDRGRKDDPVYQSPSAVRRFRKSSLQSAVDCLRDIIPPKDCDGALDDVFNEDARLSEIAFRRSNSFVAKPYNYSDSSNKSRSSDSSHSTGSSYLMNPYSTNSSSARSSSGYSKGSRSPSVSVERNFSGGRLTKDQFKPFGSQLPSELNCSKNRLKENRLNGTESNGFTAEQSFLEGSSSSDQFKAFSSIVNSSSHAQSSSSRQKSMVPSSNYEATAGQLTVGNLDPVRRPRVRSFKQDRSESFRCVQAQSIYCSADYSCPKPSSPQQGQSKSSSCSPKPVPENGYGVIRSRYVKHKPSSVSGSAGNAEEKPSFCNRGSIHNYVLSKSASSKNLRNVSPSVESFMRPSEKETWSNVQVNCSKFRQRDCLNSSKQVSRVSVNHSNLGSSFVAKELSQGSTQRGNLGKNGNYSCERNIVSRKSVGSSVLSSSSRERNNSSSMHLRSNETPSAQNTRDDCGTCCDCDDHVGDCNVSNCSCGVGRAAGSGRGTEGHHSRGKSVKRNHSFCSDSVKSSRARLLGRLPRNNSGSHHDLHRHSNGDSCCLSANGNERMSCCAYSIGDTRNPCTELPSVESCFSNSPSPKSNGQPSYGKACENASSVSCSSHRLCCSNACKNSDMLSSKSSNCNTKEPCLQSSTNNVHFFGNIFNGLSNASPNKNSARRKARSPPRTLEISANYNDNSRDVSPNTSLYALPVSQGHTPKTERSYTINLQDSYPQISSGTTPLLSPSSVTDSIRSQSSTLLSQMNFKSQAGSNVTPPNAGFDLEALLKIDDLRSWIQELETSRAKGYQTLYSDYDDCDWDLKNSNGDITQKGYEKKKTRLLQPYASKDAAPAGSYGGGGSQVVPPPRSRRGADPGGGRPRRPQHRSVTSHEQRYLSVGGGIGGVSADGSGACGSAAAAATAAANLSASKRRRQHRRVTRNESRYHSGEVRYSLSPILAVSSTQVRYSLSPKLAVSSTQVQSAQMCDGVSGNSNPCIFILKIVTAVELQLQMSHKSCCLDSSVLTQSSNSQSLLLIHLTCTAHPL
ncbi:DMAP1-binding domain [Trinorchestia longiramus]|nr:DMAP1-binding domain [Trinorchestia longiramus]